MRGSWLTPAPPTTAIEIAAGRVTVLGLSGASGTDRRITGHASEPLPDGVVVPGLAAPNILQPNVVIDALRQAIERAGLGAPRRSALVIPDSAARVSLLGFETLPARATELEELIRWQLRKATPFPIDDAQVAHFTASGHGASTMIAAVVARREVIAEYEQIAAGAGIHAGLVDLASFNVMNAAIGAGLAPAEDWLLVHRHQEATTLAILRGRDLLFYRHRTSVDEEPLGALVHQTAMYHEDRLGGGGFTRVLVSGGSADAEAAREEIRARLNVPVATIDVRAAAGLGDRIDAGHDLLAALAAPVGILIRERAA